MYVIKNDHRNAFKTYDGWTRITTTGRNATLDGLGDVIRFTKREAERNADRLPKGSRFVYFPLIEWSDFNEHSSRPT